MENKDYIKHLIKCKCILPQFERFENPPIHKFIVFSEIDSDGLVIPSFSQCNNCGIVHKIKEIGISEPLRKESISSISSIKEIQSQLPSKLLEILENSGLELHSWQEIIWIFNNEFWGKSVILTKEEIDGILIGKYIQFFSSENWRINSFTREESIASYD